MLYAFFLLMAVIYNIRKFSKKKVIFLDSLINATNTQHREIVLGHQFHIFIFEAFLAFIISHLITEGAFAIGLIGLGGIYLLIFALGLLLFQYFLRYIERSTQLQLRRSFNFYVIKEFRVSFALILLPVFIYSILNWTFQNEASTPDEGVMWFLELLTHFIFISVLTISCTVIIMLRLLPNREVTEKEYLEIINRRLYQIGMPKLRVKWIEADIKNAFVVGLKLLNFSNQTMFIGKNLRTMLSLDEFDAVISHELAHVANRHIHKRVIELLKNFVSAFMGIAVLTLMAMIFFHLYFDEDLGLHKNLVTFVCVIISLGWLFFNYSLFFDTLRSHEYEADAYAVMVMGANFSSFQSALEKLSQPEDMPEFLKKTKTNKNRRWPGKTFSTHPELDERFENLKYKIYSGLPFNYYVSRAQRIRQRLSYFIQWKISLPLTSTFILLFTWGMFRFKEGDKLVGLIQKSDSQFIMNHHELLQKINHRPYIFGKSFMFYIIQKQDPQLIDYFLANGGDLGRSLIYLAETKNITLFQSYYTTHSSSLSMDEYYLILLRCAEVRFTEGVRQLVNSSRFESLASEFKSELVKNIQNGQTERRPASLNNQ